MANITGEARHVIDTKTGKVEEGPSLTISADEGNTIVHALNSSHRSAMVALQKSAGSNDMERVAAAIASIQEVEHVLHLAHGAASEENQEEVDGQTIGLMRPTPQDLGVMVNALMAYKHTLEGGLGAIKSGEFVVVDKAPDEKLEENEISLSDYNRSKNDLESAPVIAGKLARYIREAYPEVNKTSLDFFAMQAARNRESWMTKDTGLPVGTLWDGMLSTASVLFGIEPEILDGIVQAKNAGPLN